MGDGRTESQSPARIRLRRRHYSRPRLASTERTPLNDPDVTNRRRLCDNFHFPAASFLLPQKHRIMFSLQRLFGKEDRFLDLLEASAKEAQKSAVALIKFLENVHAARTLDDFIVS